MESTVDMSQIQLIADTVIRLGEQGKGAFIVWVALDKALPFLGWMAALFVGAKVAMKLIDKLRDDYEAHLRAIRDELRIGSPGPLMPSEIRQVRERIAELRKERN